MLCSNCGRQDAEVIIKNVTKDGVQSIGLCRDCAREMGLLSPDVPSITISFSMVEPDFIKARKRRSAAKQKRLEQENALVCSECGMMYGQFRETGLLGCPACYEAFRFPLGALLQEQQGAESHWGGTSDIFSEIGAVDTDAAIDDDAQVRVVSDELSRLGSELAAAVECEQYERAAQIRDKMKRIEGETCADV